jgi:hypothetical protein
MLWLLVVAVVEQVQQVQTTVEVAVQEVFALLLDTVFQLLQR